MRTYDVAVIGGGAMGVATAYSAVRRGASVAMLERFRPGHDRGSSHGRSRVFRLAYPHSRYIELAQRALVLWRALEDDVGVALLARTGGIDHGPPERVQPIATALERAGVRARALSPAEAAERWPAMRFDQSVLHQPDAGRLDADATVLALHRRARELGVEGLYDEPAHELRPREGSVDVVTDRRTVRAGVAVVAAGAWAPSLLRDQAFAPMLPTLAVTQEQPAYFPVRDEDGWPSFIHHGAGVGTTLEHDNYGLFTPGLGLKVGEHGTGPVVDPDDRPAADPAGLRRLEAYVAEWLPGAQATATTVDTCLYTSTPDEQFVLARHGRVVVCSPCSGHGFKFVPAVGELTAQLALAEEWPPRTDRP